jgi:hypothetical protein
MSDSIAEGNHRAPSWIKKMGDLRDGLLVFGAVIYALGYLVWSIHAWKENLGLLPALEPQYLAAGTIPSLILWLAWVGYRFLRGIPDRVLRKLETASRTKAAIYRVIGVLCVAGFYLPIFFLEKIHSVNAGESVLAKTFFGLLAPILLITGLLLLLQPSKKESSAETGEAIKGNRKFGDLVRELVESFAIAPPFLARVVMYFYLSLYFVGLTAGYVFGLYPSIPQEFGGVRPRCAYVDVVRDQVSEALQSEILPGGAAQSKPAVVRSVKLQVFFSGSDFMLVKPYVEEGHIHNAKPKLFELRGPVVQAVNWCD